MNSDRHIELGGKTPVLIELEIIEWNARILRDDLSDACEAPGLNPMLKEVDRWDWLVRWLEQHGQRNKEIACGVHPRLQRFGWAMQCGPNDVELLQCRQDRRPMCRGSCGCPNNRLQGALHDRGEPGRRRPRHLQRHPRQPGVACGCTEGSWI